MRSRRVYFRWMGAWWSGPRDVVRELFAAADRGEALDLSACRELRSRPLANTRDVPVLRDRSSRLREE